MTKEPPEGKCGRCSQTRHLFQYKPTHDCIRDIGTVDLIDAMTHIAEIEDNGDHWCLSRIHRHPKRLLVCTSCFQVESRQEEEFIANVLED